MVWVAMLEYVCVQALGPCHDGPWKRLDVGHRLASHDQGGKQCGVVDHHRATAAESLEDLYTSTGCCLCIHPFVQFAVCT